MLTNHGLALVVLLAACQPVAGDDRIVVQIDGAKKTVGEAKRRLQSLSAAHKERVLQNPLRLAALLIRDDVLQHEARRRGLSVQAMNDRLTSEARGELDPNDLSDDELKPYLAADPGAPYAPPRVATSAAVFTDEASARRFLVAARRSTTLANFHQSYDRIAAELLAASRDSWTFDLEVVRGAEWPIALVDAAFGANPGSVIGPFAGASKSFPPKAYSVLRVNQKLPERNSFEERRPSLRMMAYEEKVADLVERKIVALVATCATVDEDVLATAVR